MVDLAGILHSIFLITCTLSVVFVAGLWLAAMGRNENTLGVLAVALFTGLSTIALLGQSIYYFSGSFSIAVLSILSVSILGALVFAYRCCTKELGALKNSVYIVIILICSTLILNAVVFAKGTSNYPASNNPDMWYYSAVSESILKEDNSYIDYSKALKKITWQVIKDLQGGSKLFEVRSEGYQNSVREILVAGDVEEIYYHNPGKTPLVLGVITRNGSEFVVAYLAKILNIEIKVAYNLIYALFPFLVGLSALWLVGFLKLGSKENSLVALLASFSPIVYGGAFTQWPAMVLGIPLIVYLLGLIYRLFFNQTRLIGAKLGIATIGALSIYPEGLVILVLPTVFVVIRQFLINKKSIYTAFKKAWLYILTFAILLGIPSIILTVYRLFKITGKFTHMPGPSYVNDGSFFYLMWIQPSFLHRALFWVDNPQWITGLLKFDVFSIMHLVAIVLGLLWSVYIFIGPWIIKNNCSFVARQISGSFIILVASLHYIGSPYSIDKLVYYYPAMFAVIAVLILRSCHEIKIYSILRVSHIIIFSWIALSTLSVVGLIYAELNHAKHFIPDSDFPLNKYTETREINKTLPADAATLLVALPDEIPQLWLTHYIRDINLALPHGLNYLSNYVDSAIAKYGEKYFADYKYMVIPGSEYPTIEDYRFIQQMQIWSNGTFAVVPRHFFYVLAEPISSGQIDQRSFFRLERAANGMPYRWVNTGLRYKYFNGDLLDNRLLSLKADCEAVDSRPVQLSINVDGKQLETYKLEGRKTIEINSKVRLSSSGQFEISNMDPHPIVFPRDERPVTFRCFSIQLGKNEWLVDPVRREVVMRGDIMDLASSDIHGLYSDGWMANEIDFRLVKSINNRSISLIGSRPVGLFTGRTNITVMRGKEVVGSYSVGIGEFSVDFTLSGSPFDDLIKIKFDHDVIIPAPDSRYVSGIIKQIKISE